LSANRAANNDIPNKGKNHLNELSDRLWSK